MRELLHKPGFSAAFVGALLIIELAAVLAFFNADWASVYFLGHPLSMECSFKHTYGIPCPACGASRAFVLTVHGSILQGWSLNPLGPLAAIGMFGAGLGLLILGTLTRAARIVRAFQTAALVYIAASTLVCALTWVRTVLHIVRWASS